VTGLGKGRAGHGLGTRTVRTGHALDTSMSTDKTGHGLDTVTSEIGHGLGMDWARDWGTNTITDGTEHRLSTDTDELGTDDLGTGKLGTS